MTASSNDERRSFHRILFDAPATLICGQHSFSVKLMDISLNGALLHLPENWSEPAQDQVNLDIQLSEATHIKMEASVTHSGPEGLGLRCNHIDMDSISHLRRLVELNLGDAALLERELEALG